MITLWMIFFGAWATARAEYSDWCSDAVTYRLDIPGHPLVARVGDGGRVCDDDGAGALRPVTRFSATGGLTSVASYYAFFDQRVRMDLRHLKFRCAGGLDCAPVRAGERCAIVNPAANVWPGAEAYLAELKADQVSPRTLKFAFERVAWNALLGVGPARSAVADQSKWGSFGLDEAARAALKDDLAFARRHCEEIPADAGGGLLAAGRVGVLENERLVPLAEFYDAHWNASETAFHSLYKRLDAGAAEAWALRTAVPAPLETRWHEVGVIEKISRPLDLELPFLLTTEDVLRRRGFFEIKTPAPGPARDVRVITSLAPAKDPDDWRALPKIPPAVVQRGRDLFRAEFPKRFECLPSVEDDAAEVMHQTAGPFTDADVEVFRAHRTKLGDVLVGVRARRRCRQPGVNEAAFSPVLQTHWFFVPKLGSARLVARAKDAKFAADFDGDGRSEWFFSSQGIDARAPYSYALFDSARGEIIEAR